jgi:hypothetical protein
VPDVLVRTLQAERGLGVQLFCHRASLRGRSARTRTRESSVTTAEPADMLGVTSRES